MRLLFIMDPVSTVIVDEDTSFALMLAAQIQGHRVDHALVPDVAVEFGEAYAHVRRATMDPSSAATPAA